MEESALPSETTATKDELRAYFDRMVVMRRMEIVSDLLYKKKEINGFCHLYDGQEAIAEGMEAAMTKDDCLISAYRIHCQQLARGDTAYRILAEMMGRQTGSSKGKGGSMHFYSSKNNFYGGNGIVGAQMPVGTGLAFAQKYSGKKNFTVAMYGDGAASQGQFAEAMNMAGLWKLPIVYVCENNLYGMGTSNERHSHNTKFYARGDLLPGFKMEGQNVLAVREAIKFAGNHSIEHSPMLIEFSTYRYHGHSMSDPGVTYRTKEEIADVRAQRDPIEIVRKMILDNSWAGASELKDYEKMVRRQMDEDVEKIKKDPFPGPEELYTDIAVNNDDHYVRGVEHKLTRWEA